MMLEPLTMCEILHAIPTLNHYVPNKHATLNMLKLHNCFAYFIQKINPWRMVFYFIILLLRLLSY